MLKVMKGGEIVITADEVESSGYWRFNDAPQDYNRREVMLALIDWALDRLLAERESITLQRPPREIR